MSNIHVTQAFAQHRETLDEGSLRAKYPNLVEITVSGKGDFPMDMLRYCRCWPCDGTSAANLITPSYPEQDGREVSMHLAGPDNEAQVQGYADRFASFGWSISEVRIY